MTLCMNRTVAWWETTPYHTTKWQDQSQLLQTGMVTEMRDERALKCGQVRGSGGMLIVVLQASAVTGYDMYMYYVAVI